VTILVGGYSQFERQLIVAAYYSSNQLDKDKITIAEIGDRYELDANFRWLRTALGNLYTSGLSKETLHSGALTEHRIWLTAEGIREAERIIQTEPPTFVTPKNSSVGAESVAEDPEALKGVEPSAIDSSTWTGRSTVRQLDEARRVKLVALIESAEKNVEEAELGNFERSQALSYIVAIKALAEAPEPPSDLIWELASRANNLAGVAALFVSIIGLFS